MHARERPGRTSIIGQVTRVEICPCGTWKVSVGSTTWALDRATAGDLCNTLALALDRTGPQGPDRLVVFETVQGHRREN
jgi:hypothetical protein